MNFVKQNLENIENIQKAKFFHFSILSKEQIGFGVGYRCACPIGQKLVDGKRCVPSIDYLLFSSNKVVRGIYPEIMQNALAEVCTNSKINW